MSSVTQTLIKDLKNMASKLSPREIAENYQKEPHWQKMGLSCEAVSKECTKLAVAFSKPPMPTDKDTELLIRDVAQAIDVLVAWYKAFPLSEGQILNNVLQKCVNAIIYAVCEFLESVENNKCSGGKGRLTSTGTVWECCDKFKTLPQDNTTAAVNEINVCYKLVSDAMTEVEETVKEHDEHILNSIDDMSDEEDENWSASDRALVKPCIGMLMASRGLLKKSKSLLNKNSNISNTEVDMLVDVILSVSPSVDDFVMSLYPPLFRTNLMDRAFELETCIVKIINYIRSLPSFNTEEHSWSDFVEKAVHHNFNILSSLISTI